MTLAKYATPSTGVFTRDTTVVNDFLATTTPPAQVKDLRGGPCTLYSILVSNRIEAAANCYLKLFDIIDSTFVPATSLPVCIVQVLPYGVGSFECLEGVQFENGISISVSQTAGNLDTTPVDAADDFNIALSTKKGLN